MSERLKALRDERMRVITTMRGITDLAQTEKRDLTGEELAKHGELFTRQEAVAAQITAEERSLEVARVAAGAAGDRAAEQREDPVAPARPNASPEYRAAFRSFLAHGRSGMSADELRALSVGVGSQGGFTVVPEQFANSLIKFVDDNVVVRQLATKIPVMNAASLGVPSLETDIADADWTTEIATGNEDSAMAFGKRKMVPSPLAKLIKVSNDLLRVASGGAGLIDIESLVRNRLGYKFAIAQEKAFFLGTGAAQPLGMFVAHADGIPTARDYSTGNSTTSITFDGLIGARYAIKDQYRKDAQWLFHRNGIGQIAGLKDSYGRYLWQPSQQLGVPDMLLGSPVISSEYVPNTFTTGQYVGMFANFSFYWIADSLDLQIQRLVELYAATNQTGFIGRLFTDGQPVLAEAFVRVKLG